MKKLLKPYCWKLQAVKITHRNYDELLKLDMGDGCLLGLTKEEAIGEWFVYVSGGFEVWPAHLNLIPVVAERSEK